VYVECSETKESFFIGSPIFSFSCFSQLLNKLKNK
jgi:hypothetical protein